MHKGEEREKIGKIQRRRKDRKSKRDMTCMQIDTCDECATSTSVTRNHLLPAFDTSVPPADETCAPTNKSSPQSEKSKVR